MQSTLPTGIDILVSACERLIIIILSESTYGDHFTKLCDELEVMMYT